MGIIAFDPFSFLGDSVLSYINHHYRPMNRREFSKLAALSSAAILSSKTALSAKESASASSDNLSVHLFSKHLQFLDYKEMAKVAAEIGFDGLDLTVRPRGHVEPENVKRDLPKAVEAIRSQGMQPVMMASGINNAEDPVNVQVLNTASELGFQYYRLAYYKFPEDGTWKQNMDKIKATFTRLGKLNKKLGIHGAYQNHSGTGMGSYMPDIAYVLEGADPRWSSCQFDIRHANVEGGTAWPLGLRWVKDHIKTIAIKDYRWEMRDGERKVVNVPIGEGIVDFDKYFKQLRSYSIKPIVSLHLEYDLGGADHGHREITIPREKVYAAMRRDLEGLHKRWKASA